RLVPAAFGACDDPVGIRSLAGSPRQAAGIALAGPLRTALPAGPDRLPDAPGARLAQQLRNPLPFAVQPALVLWRHPVHHRSLAVARPRLRNLAFAAPGEGGECQLAASGTGRPRAGAHL